MKELMKSNIYDVDETIIVVGSCLKNMQLKGYEALQKISNNIYLNTCFKNKLFNILRHISLASAFKNIILWRSILEFALINWSSHTLPPMSGKKILPSTKGII